MNNYDKSSSGTDIEFSVRYDTWLPQSNFNESMHCLKQSGYRTASLYQYIEYGNFEKTSLNELMCIDRKQTLKKFLLEYALGVDWNFWEKSEIRKMNKDDLCDLIEQDMDENDLDLSERREFADSKVIFLEVDNFTFYETRGYSQGDYAEWCIRDSDLAEFKNGHDWLGEHVSHLFWDAPVIYSLSVDDEEYFINEHVKNQYDYSADEVYKICEKLFEKHQHKEYILAFISENSPECPEYD